MGSIVFFGSEDDKAQRYLEIWLEIAGGSMSLDELTRKYRERFNCNPDFAVDGTTVAKLSASGSIAFRFHEGIVSLPTVH